MGRRLPEMSPAALRLDSAGPLTRWPSHSAGGVRWWLRSCPRCHGDTYRHYGIPEWSCLQCGWNGPTSRGTLPDKPRLRLYPVGEVMLLAGGEDVGEGLRGTV